MSELPNVKLRSYDPLRRAHTGMTFPGNRLEPKLIEQLRGDGDLCDIVNAFKAEFELQGIQMDDLSLLEHSVMILPWINRWLTEEDYHEGSYEWKQLHRLRDLLRQHGSLSDEQIIGALPDEGESTTSS
jgi:hypothetical protein